MFLISYHNFESSLCSSCNIRIQHILHNVFGSRVSDHTATQYSGYTDWFYNVCRWIFVTDASPKLHRNKTQTFPWTDLSDTSMETSFLTGISYIRELEIYILLRKSCLDPLSLKCNVSSPLIHTRQTCHRFHVKMLQHKRAMNLLKKDAKVVYNLEKSSCVKV